MKTPQKFIVFSLVFSLLNLGACGGLTRSDTPANRTWWLTPYTAAVPETPPETTTPVSLIITVVPGLDTNRILTLSGEAELNRYASARWAENLPELVESLIGRTLESSGRFEVVSSRAGASAGACDLQLEVREFFAELNSGGETSGVRVAVNGRYQCGAGEATAIQLKASEAVHEERMSVIVGAFQRAVDDVMRDLLEAI